MKPKGLKRKRAEGFIRKRSKWFEGLSYSIIHTSEKQFTFRYIDKLGRIVYTVMDYHGRWKLTKIILRPGTELLY